MLHKTVLVRHPSAITKSRRKIQNMKKILFVGSEVMPFAATGGLGDVLGSLPSEIKKEMGEDSDIRVIMPMYSNIGEQWLQQMEKVAEFEVSLSWRKLYCGINKIEKDGVVYYFVDNQYYFYRQNMYGEYDDGERFAFFCRAVLEAMNVLDYFPDVLHANDWHTALCPVYLRTYYLNDQRYQKVKSVFTIHNIEYQGKFDFNIVNDVFDLSDYDRQILEYEGGINLVKAAVVCADKVTTVSPTYANEILYPEHSHGLYHVLNLYSDKLCGILNGIDYDYYNPSSEELAQKFTWRSPKRKAINKNALQEEIGLPKRDDVPMLAVISRLASHKGLDLVEEKLYNIVSENDVQVVVLGKGEKRYEEFFSRLQENFPDKVSALMMYDRDLAKRIYAAADIFVMPSLSEPCGLAQMIASRYGAIPVVRETGGLYDSIKPYSEDGDKISGNGFTFSHYNSDALKGAILDAVNLWNDEERRNRFVSKIMRTDFSWKNSAKQYLRMYDTI